jgi:hypothetical protein
MRVIDQKLGQLRKFADDADNLDPALASEIDAVIPCRAALPILHTGDAP